MYRPTLVTYYQSGLVRVETHTVNGRVHLEHTLTLLVMTPIGKGLVIVTPICMPRPPEVPYPCHTVLTSTVH